MLNWIGTAAAVIALTSALKIAPVDRNGFDELVKDQDLVLVEFCVPWYKPCMNLSAELDKAATRLAKRDISIVSVDCTQKKLKDVCKDYDVQSYPTLRIFNGLGENVRYRGRQDEQAIVSYVIKQNLPVVLFVDDQPDDRNDEIWSLGFPILVLHVLGSKPDEALNSVFRSVAENLRHEFVFVIALYQDTLGETYNVALINPLDETVRWLNGRSELKEDELMRFARSDPLIGKFGPDNFAKYTDSEIPLALIFAETAEERKSFGMSLERIAQTHLGRMNFVTVDAKKYGFFAESLGLDATRFPGFVIHDTGTDKMYQFDQSKPITSEAIGKFVWDFLPRLAGDGSFLVEGVITASSETWAHNEM